MYHIKSKNKFFIAIFIFIFVVFLSSLPVQAASVKIKLNKTSAILYTNGSKTIKLRAVVKGTKKKAKWKSGNRSVAVVSQTGKVTAKKAGKATITAKVGKKTAKCKITVKTTSAPKIYQTLLAKKTVRASDATGSVSVPLSGALFAIQDLNKDKIKELLIRPKSDAGYGLGDVYIFTARNNKAVYIGCMPCSGTVTLPGYGQKSNMPYVYSKNHYGDYYNWEIYGIKSGKLTKITELRIIYGSPGKVQSTYINDKKVTYTQFQKTYNKYLDTPFPQYQGMFNGRWEGFHTFNFQENTDANRKKYLK